MLSFLLYCTLYIANGQNGQLKCNSNGTFKILQFTDTHFGEAQSKDEQSVASFESLIGFENPDLIALTGDFITGSATNGSAGWFEDIFNYAMQPILASEIPFSYTLGNHDDGADWNRTQIIKYAASLSNSQTYLGPANITGASNFVLTVFDQYNKPAMNIWFLDSMDANCYNVKGWGCVEFSAVEWYRQTSIDLENKFEILLPAIMYIHIPLPELLNTYNNFKTMGELESGGIRCSSLNTGLFSVIKERGDVISIWHGHDHDNDFYGNYHGVNIGYGRKTGFGSWGPPENMPRGARVIQFECNNASSINTWIRENNGTKVVNQPSHQSDDWKNFTQCMDSAGGVTSRQYIKFMSKK